jgi:GT2 family glycosyltransferase
VTSLQETTYVRWLPSGAAFYTKEALEEFPFDEWFENYSYLEDLDLSYRIGKKYRLAVLADARFYHYPSEVGRASAYLFGKKEVLNRLYFVSKHPEFSRPLCCLALSLRTLMSLLLGVRRFEADYLRRAAGNFVGFAMSWRRGSETALGSNSG